MILPATRSFAAILLALAAGVLLEGQSLMAQTVVWSGSAATNSANTNWSAAGNWTGGTPGPGTNVCFFDAGATGTPGVVNNIVSSNLTIFSLQYGNTNNYHTTLINPGVTLTVSNTGAGTLVFVGTGTDNGGSQRVEATITGAGGHWVVADTNAGSQMIVQQGSGTAGTHNATLNLAGLDTFTLTAGRLLVGGFAGSSSNPSNWLSGTLILAKTNVIQLNGTTAPVLDAGDAVNNGATNSVLLGQTNALHLDTLTIGYSKATSTLQFNPAFTNNPTLYLRGETAAAVSTLAIGDFSAQSTSASTTVGTLNLGGGTVDAEVHTGYVGRGQTGDGSGTATGTLMIGSGVFNVNTLNVGYVSTATAIGNVTGTVTVTNGTLVVNSNLVLGYNPGATAAAAGTLNLTNGTVLADNIVAGGGNSKIVMSGGWLAVTNTLGTPAAPLTSLTLDHGGTLEFWVTNHLTNAALSAVASDNSGAIAIGALPLIPGYPSAWPLIYCPNGGASGIALALGSLPGIYRGYISNDNASTIWLVITNGPAPPKTDQWGGGVSDNWDTNTLNWTNNGLAAAYAENDFVLFNDAARTGVVILTGTTPHTPSSWTVTNNVLNYVFAGTNGVGGPVALNKSGSASLTLVESGDSFSGGITVNGGTVTLDEASSAISGGLSIGSGGTVQIGDNDNRGGLPAGAVNDNGALVFDQTGTNLVTTAISGSGSLTQEGSGTLELGGANGYTGNTLVLDGTLALTGAGAMASSAKVEVSNGRLDVSGVTGTTSLGALLMTNGVISVGAAPVSVASLNLGGAGNTINVNAGPPPGYLFYPTNITLMQAATGITGNNLALGSLPAGKPAYAGSVGVEGKAVVLTLTAGPLAVVPATVSFAATNTGWALNPAFCGLSYEKSQLTAHLFTATNTALIKMFSQIAPAVLRIGGNSVDTTCWGGLSNETPITAAEVSAFAGFVKALPAGWHVIYGINMSVNTPANCAAEAAYAANALGASLLGFEIGNECDLYSGNGIRATDYTFAEFLSQWQTLAGAITNAVPGWAVTNGGTGYTLTGPASAGNTTGYTVPFAGDEAGVISLVTQHYYRGNGQSTNSTIELLLQPDTGLPGTVKIIVSAATAAKLPLGFRMDECGSFYNGGAPNVSDAYGTALWALDYMLTLAVNGCQGINFHGGGDGTGYTPIADNGTTVVQARPEFYGLKMFSLLPPGNVITAAVSLATNINFTAYGVRETNGTIGALLNNKDTNDAAQVTIYLGGDVTSAEVTELTGPGLNSTNGYTIGGAEINADGTWAGGVQAVIPATNGTLTVTVPPISAVLLNPVVTGAPIGFSVTGREFNLSWPTNYTGWWLQSNSTGLTGSNDWFTVPGSTSLNSLRITIDPSRTKVFYRMVEP